ncbi:MAG: hypothetical protein QM780_13195 [Hyphomicrobium sp.]
MSDKLTEESGKKLPLSSAFSGQMMPPEPIRDARRYFLQSSLGGQAHDG